MESRSRIGACCKECTERYEACHDSCEKYKDAHDKWMEYKSKVKQGRMLSEYDQYKMDSIKKMQRRRKHYDRKG